MDSMAPQQQQQDGLCRDNKRRMKSQSCRRQSAPSLVISKALTRSKTLSRESFLLPVCPDTCPLVQSFLSASDRKFLLHAHAQLKTGMQTQDRHLFMFTDILVVAKIKSANQFKQKAGVRVCEMWTANCMEEVCEGSTNPERGFVMGWPMYNCVATFSSSEQKEKWLTLLKSRIKEEKEKEEPKTIPLRVYGKGINTFAVTKTLPVSNSDSTNEVIRLALQQFGIIGNVKDYQLWVVSKRDNTPYPLIGHEFPFSIQMSHVRQTLTPGGPAADKQRAQLQTEQLQASKHCQFIMKPRPLEALQQPATSDLPQKTFKRRRSLIAWAFWRGSSSQLSDFTLASAARGCLFNQPLAAVCIEDALPKPVMDMLTFLYHEGPWTRGIFRRPAGARAVRELRDSLDGGGFQLPLTRDHIFIIAGVFKDFLRSIPGSLLCSELHQEWMEVLEDEEEEEEQLQDVQRMIGRLPKQNTLLLRYLLAVLHAIRGNAQENQMTSFNLAVCIAPSMLWPPGAPSSPEVEGQGTKRVCELVKFMIEHCEQILGEEPSSLFGCPPQRLHTEEIKSDPWMDPLTDSSYDSLENELDTSSGGSPGICNRRALHGKPRHGSLDSVLTVSDCEQDTDPDTQQLDLYRYGRSAGGRRQPDPSRPHRDVPASDASLCPDAWHGQRRRSEPVLKYVTKFQPCCSESAEGLAGGQQLPALVATQSRRGRSGETRRSAALEVSSPSLSSNPCSPAPTCSSLDSLDSLSSDRPSTTRQGLHPTASVPSMSSIMDKQTSLRDLPPKEPPSNRATLRGCIGLHPNSWLKKDRRLSLTQEDNLEKEESNKPGGGPAEKTSAVRKRVPEKESGGDRGGKLANPKASKEAGGHVKVKPDQETQKLHPKKDTPSHHRSTGSLQLPVAAWFQASDSHLHAGNGGDVTGREGATGQGKQLSPSLFYKHGASLSLFKRRKSQSAEAAFNARLYQRRRSEPGHQAADRAATATRARLPSDPGLKVSEVEPQGETAEPRFCLSPHATKAVRDYFSAHPHSNPKSGQQVALALVDTRREWMKRCSDPGVEADLEQLLFAEESYV